MSIPKNLTDLLDFYRGFVNDGVSLQDDSTRERLLLACMGLAGETGETVDLLKKALFHNKELDRADLIKELGDVLWYFQLLLLTEGIEWDEVIIGNIKKLVERYPDKHPGFAVPPRYITDALSDGDR